ncbi:MAG: RAMP superfamily protein [candidate division TA06 bacterium ADurb.Bin417]|uniref:CRISPR system Cms protein Csm5 n=1 Tax=candidate division TA06 bacterium ADurb.Bin417 TaxID=1852828 RepID=A0A1V5MKK9_UNCT6|nr:MAG: RAMP superfamily protein [candidate division TA06 bacterium ADurb.Bin417]
MKVKIRILSPVHIGDGLNLSPSEYFISTGQLNRLDMDGLVADPEFLPHLDRFVSQAKTNRYIGDYIQPSILSRHILYSIPIAGEAATSNPTNLKTFIKTAGRVYLPGSSLKGALLSALIYALMSGKKPDAIPWRDNKEMMKQVIGSATTNSSQTDNFARWLDVTDSDYRPPADALEVSLVQVTRIIPSDDMQGRKKNLPLLCETLREDTEFGLEIKNSNRAEPKGWGKFTPAEILKFSDTYYRKIWEEENEDSPQLNRDGHLCRLGQGSGVLSTSLLTLARELGYKGYQVERRKPPRPITIENGPLTQKLVDEEVPLGWVEIIPV